MVAKGRFELPTLTPCFLRINECWLIVRSHCKVALLIGFVKLIDIITVSVMCINGVTDHMLLLVFNCKTYGIN